MTHKRKSINEHPPYDFLYDTLLLVVSAPGFAENEGSDAARIGAALHAAYKGNTTESEYAYMRERAAVAHGGASLEEVLNMCVDVTLGGGRYPPEHVRAVLVLAESLKSNDETMFTSNVKMASIQIAMQIHAEILACAMPDTGKFEALTTP